MACWGMFAIAVTAMHAVEHIVVTQRGVFLADKLKKKKKRIVDSVFLGKICRMLLWLLMTE